MKLRAFMPRVLLAAALAVPPALAQAQSVGDAISSALFENVIYAQAKLKVSAKLVRLHRMVVATGGDHLALLAEDGTIRVWNLLRGSQGRPIPVGKDVVFAPSADGTLLMLGGASGKIELRDARTGAAVGSLASKGGAITKLATSPDSLQLIVGSKSGRVEIWDLAARKMLVAGKAANAPITAIAVGTQAMVGSADGAVAAVDLATGAAKVVATVDGPVTDLRIAADGKQAAVADGKGHINIVSQAGGKSQDSDVEGEGLLAIGQSLRMAAIMDGKDEIDVIDLDNGRGVAELKVEEGTIIGLHVDDVANSVIAATADGKLLVWDVPSKKQILSIFISPTG
ncbi:MAG TPA: PQQ-binding-like beta-propeller repeat protein, partial [Dongiaceae bacterium]|nr:PQQ-binding-like beta-propeller repeat protein [Dongiaceae bacterium]